MYTANSRAPTEKKYLKSIIDMPIKERKQNDIKCSIKMTKCKQERKKTIGTKNESNDMVTTNQILIMNTQKRKRRENNHNPKEIHKM